MLWPWCLFIAIETPRQSVKQRLLQTGTRKRVRATKAETGTQPSSMIPRYPGEERLAILLGEQSLELVLLRQCLWWSAVEGNPSCHPLGLTGGYFKEDAII